MEKIKLEGAYNFRDIGGYRTKDGKTVKTGLLYRSDELSKLSESDVALLEKIGIKTIVDYRAKRERIDNEDVPIEGSTIIYLDPKADVAALASSENKDILEKNRSMISSKQAYSLMYRQNEEFVLAETSKSSYRKLLKLLLDTGNCPLVQHCRGGKDRTGYGAALILLLLGVDQETVLKDYLLTNVYKKEKNERSLKEVYDKTGNKDFVLALRYLKEARKEFLLAALNLIEEQFNGIENYVIRELGLTIEEVTKIRENYLQ
ncbi:tyrosine-protein phosphatase [Massilicoli timonensis]|uniref:tyrosine-protein phosphatase n=1 Tax=Massilicoli timonensis TaxID=2015901 RepID=UPI000C829EC3|nr:tyrosine-protein phosphatase [Massilicoli timonensis]